MTARSARFASRQALCVTLQPNGYQAMDYLFLKLFWFVAFAFALGIAVGWFTCRNSD